MQEQQEEQQESPLSRPWQYDWKRPAWNWLPAEETQHEVQQDAAQQQQVVIDHTAACVGSEYDENHEVSYSVHESWLLTVTLVNERRVCESNSTEQPPGGPRDSGVPTEEPSDVQGGNLLKVQLLSQPTLNDDSATSLRPTVRKRKLLRFGETILQRDHRKHSWQQWWQSWGRKADDKTSNEETPCIRSIVLYREPAPNAAAQHAAAAELLPLLSLLSQDAKTSSNSNTTAPPPNEPTHLRLACLTHDNRVLIYNPWNLLRSTVSLDPASVFLLGASLAQTVRETILPLSEPIRQIPLSGPPEQSSQKESNNSPAEEEDGVNFGPIQNESPFSVWGNPAAWDVLLEPHSFQCFATISNHVWIRTAVVHDYLAVLGRGQTSRDCGGGMITFCSLDSLAQVRTVFLPAPPCTVTGIRYRASRWALVTMQNATVVLINVDHCSAILSLSMIVRPFQLVPVQMPVTEHVFAASSPPSLVCCNIETNTTGGMEDSSTGPNRTVKIVQRSLDKPTIVSREDAGCWAEYPLRIQVVTHEEPAHIATLPCQVNGLRCLAGGGWSLVSTGPSQTFFVCWEGSRAKAFVQKLDESAESEGLFRHILPANPYFLPVEDDVQPPSTQRFPLTLEDIVDGDPLALKASSDPTLLLKYPSSSNAVISTSSPSLQPKLASTDDVSNPPACAFKQEEKQAQLLKLCGNLHSSDLTVQKHDVFRQQLPRVSACWGPTNGDSVLLSFRKSAVEGRTRTSFSSLLLWLSSEDNYVVAASLALALLGDSDTLAHLWSCFQLSDSFGESEVDQGLLDGVMRVTSEEDDPELIRRTNTELADLAIGCLIRGDGKLRGTLNHFLVENECYDPARVSLMLASEASKNVSDFLSASKGIESGEKARDFDSLLWPVQFLLDVGVARDVFVSVLLLLNATIPDELRCHPRRDDVASPPPSLALCKNLISRIASASNESIQVLLGLVDEQSGQPFWESLAPSTRMDLALLCVNGGFPFLRNAEIRLWVVSELQRSIEKEASLMMDGRKTLQNDWLSELVFACLFNAECPLVRDISGNVTPDDSTIPMSEMDAFRDRNLYLHSAVKSRNDSGGLDFDLVVPALLTLHLRNEVQWHPFAQVSTKELLLTVCDVAGRPQTDIPLFTMNSSLLMRQCVLAGNIQAGAKLIGGMNGLVLECCEILISRTGITMEQAELFVRSDTLPSTSNTSTTSGDKSQLDTCFVLSEHHQRLVWMLERHVLSVRKFGDFDATHTRGKLEPVQVARHVLRTWWFINIDHHAGAATDWLVTWLSTELGLGQQDQLGNSNMGPFRLACAAVTRAVIWADEKESLHVSNTLAHRMQLPTPFLLSLSLSCRGLVEALPAYIVKEGWHQLSATKNGTSPTKSNETMGDSFQSAVSSL